MPCAALAATRVAPPVTTPFRNLVAVSSRVVTGASLPITAARGHELIAAADAYSVLVIDRLAPPRATAAIRRRCAQSPPAALSRQVPIPIANKPLRFEDSGTPVPNG